MSKLEYLNPIDWSLHVIDGENECVPDGGVEVPEGAEIAIKFKNSSFANNGIIFYKNNGFCYAEEKNNFKWDDGSSWDMGSLLDENYCCDGIDLSHNILWQRSKSLNDQERIETASGYGLDRIGNNIYGTRSRYKGESDSSYRNYLMNFGKSKPSLNDQYAEIEEVCQNNVDSILSERQSQYGCYEDVAKTTQDILKALRIGNYENMPAPHQEALHMIASKIARLVHGNANHLDSWVDIGGYSKLIVNLIEGGK